MKIWAISDAAAGNRRQTAALSMALGGEVETVILQPRRPWRWLSPRRLPGALQAFGATFADRLQQPPALAIGCGRQAALATRLLRERGCPAVQILDPRIDPRHWDLLITPAHDGLVADNVLGTLGSLNPVDAEWLARARADWPQLATLPSPRTLLLLGGPTADAPYGRADWERTTSTLDAWRRRDGGSLLVSGSRRTPGWLVVAARQWLAGQPGLHWFDDGDGDNPYPGLLGWAERIVLTADSTNMLSEACATGVPVLCATMPRPGSRIARLHRVLADSARLQQLGVDYAPWHYEPLRETAAVAEAVRQRLGLLAGREVAGAASGRA